MQTFLPYPEFDKTFQCLDRTRLGKQRLEAKQILDILLKRTLSRAWIHHPAVLMWKGFEEALQDDFNKCLDEWERRDYVNNIPREVIVHPIKWPHWLGLDAFHASHRSNLLRKDYSYYRQFGWTEPNNLPYLWPVNL